jgi:hypothetical protein
VTSRFATRAGMLALSMGLLGCFGNSATMFPAGLEPWEPMNMATPPAAQPGDPYPEQITFYRTSWRDPATMRSVPSVHARAFIRAPLAAVWPAIHDPQTGRDPVSSHGFRVVEWATEPMYAFSYKTYVLVHNVIELEWNVNWRHGVVEGTLDAPRVVSARWQKTWGSDAIRALEGSLVARVAPNDPNVTALEYQYHLDSVASGHDTIEGYLRVIYGRTRDRAHGVPLDPNDCMDCPPAPPGY